MGKEMNILTVEEFLKIGEKETVIVETKINGRPRCEHRGHVRNLKCVETSAVKDTSSLSR